MIGVAVSYVVDVVGCAVVVGYGDNIGAVAVVIVIVRCVVVVSAYGVGKQQHQHW